MSCLMMDEEEDMGRKRWECRGGCGVNQKRVKGGKKIVKIVTSSGDENDGRVKMGSLKKRVRRREEDGMVFRVTEGSLQFLRDVGLDGEVDGWDIGGLVVTTLDVREWGLTTDGAMRVMTVPNAGGDSVLSEALSAEMLLTAVWPERKGRCGEVGTAFLGATEMEVRYFPHGGSMLDYVLGVRCEGGLGVKNVGVSVTRAFAAQDVTRGMRGRRAKLRQEDAVRLLWKKMTGIKYAARNVCTPRDGLDALILHVFVPDGQAAKVLRMAYRRVSAEVRAGTVVLVTVCNAQCIFKRTRGAPQMIF